MSFLAYVPLAGFIGTGVWVCRVFRFYYSRLKQVYLEEGMELPVPGPFAPRGAWSVFDVAPGDNQRIISAKACFLALAQQRLKYAPLIAVLFLISGFVFLGDS